MNNSIRLAGIAYESLVNGPGMRRVFFTQGCRHNCPGCFNPETHNFTTGEDRNMDELIKEVKENPMIKGVTFSGGDPFEQADKVTYMAKKFKGMGLNIWSYTGYTYEYMISNFNERPEWKSLLENLDVLVDGRFEDDKKDASLKFRGSSNQRIIDVPRSLKEGLVCLVEKYYN